MNLPIEVGPSTDDQAARAAWLYYVGGLTQDQIATEMGVSRQRAQRLVSRAVAAGLIHVRLNHHLASCQELETALRERFHLVRCRVMPGLGPDRDPVRAIAPAAAAEMERVLREPTPLVVALGTGRAMRGMVEALGVIDAPQHRLVSLIGNIAPDGSASYFDVIMRLAEKVHAPHYPMPVPVISDTAEENLTFQSLGPVRKVRELARAADVTFVGVGQMSDDAPLLTDGFLKPAELSEVQRAGAVGEVAGRIFDAEGRYLDLAINQRLGGMHAPAPRPDRPVIGLAAGPSKVAAIAAALRSGILNGLITDEPTARSVLAT
ncbi:sugar-binding transcriptional regulator [Ancylobacter defluvii]|uniref:DNA-binding transcriptional regulator n=1 Tax=Ancylobacter defluvii TaxID=1282440 RepID=A0A9W6NDR6_9HYPH|nr:sugar-binding transcriptional regulator [Ancylobacter defluvii]MBS7588425.1 sugar-binding transcriptional regulator [Ancylobacter defluvii]GLK86831.1 DNA-binding transcriptional regulator [Ancylobacter defluvii]